MKNINSKILLLFSFLILSLPASDIDWSYSDAYDDQMLYLHPMINYYYNAQWQFNWEERQFSDNGFRITVGSVTTTDLLTDWGLFINHELGAGWRFQGIGTWNETRHKSIFEKSAFMGLEKNIYSGLNIHLLVNPSYYKENTDLNAGFSVYNDSRQSYIRLALQYEDFVYDSKNDFAGKSIQAPLSATWSARAGRDHFWLYTEGRISTGFKRTFPDEEKSPDLRTHDQARNDIKLKFYYTYDNSSLTMLGFRVYQFFEEKTFSEQFKNYDYENIFTDYFIEHINSINPKSRIRIMGHVVVQDASNSGYQVHRFTRRDILAGGFYEYLIGRHTIEIGYMFSLYDYEYEDFGFNSDYKSDGYTDKLKLGWLFSFPNHAQINISISHQMTLGGFGGANLQYIMFF